MGLFLAITSVIGKSQDEVVNSLANYASSVRGGLQLADNIDADTPNACFIEERNNNTSIYYPNGYLEWDESSQFISKELNTSVFSFHIHDGDFWMYMLYKNGELIDQFNPVPAYWDDKLSEKEIELWKGNPLVIANAIPYIQPAGIDKYLVRWNLEEEDPPKAYISDEFTQEDWQLIDFMTKLKLPIPLDEDGEPNGQIYKLWTNQLKLTNRQPRSVVKVRGKKPWWKIW
jgi:hypothetical protein